MGNHLPKKPLANELCAIRARNEMKRAKSKGIQPLCASCDAEKYTVCAATGHVICSKLKHIEWRPVPFTQHGCGLYIKRDEAASVSAPVA